MNMKKIISLVLAAAMVLSFSACGSSTSTTSKESSAEASSTAAETSQSTDDSNAVVASDYADGTAAAELAALYNGGYTMGSSNNSDGVTVVNFVNADHTDFRQATCSMTGEQLDAYFAIDFMADDYYQQCFDALAACEDLQISQPTLPDASEYEIYVGKTVGEMEDAGVDLAGYNDDENGKLILNFYVYPDEGEGYTVQVTPEGNPDDDGSYDDDSIRDLVVGEIVFWEF